MSLKLEHITYTYNPGTAYETHALRDVSLEIPRASLWGLSDIREAENPR